MAFLGFMFAHTFHHRIEKRMKRLFIMPILSIIPFSIYFAFFPIYRGDFVNIHYQPEELEEFPIKLTLNVVVLPYCPYCHETIKLMNKLKHQNPKLNIRYVVLSDVKNNQRLFRSKLDSRIAVSLSKNTKDLIMMARGGFPCMILSKNKKVIYAWQNEYFGVRAIDDIISRISK